jgi:hypothetical protein
MKSHVRLPIKSGKLTMCVLEVKIPSAHADRDDNDVFVLNLVRPSSTVFWAQADLSSTRHRLTLALWTTATQACSVAVIPANDYGTVPHPDTVKISQALWRRADDLTSKPTLLFGFYERHRTRHSHPSSRLCHAMIGCRMQLSCLCAYRPVRGRRVGLQQQDRRAIAGALCPSSELAVRRASVTHSLPFLMNCADLSRQSLIADALTRIYSRPEWPISSSCAPTAYQVKLCLPQ